MPKKTLTFTNKQDLIRTALVKKGIHKKALAIKMGLTPSDISHLLDSTLESNVDDALALLSDSRV